MITIIKNANDTWTVHYSADLGQRYQEFKTWEEVNEFVEALELTV